jgi:hypothetical protein
LIDHTPLSHSHRFLKNQKPFNANPANEAKNLNFRPFREIRCFAPFALKLRHKANSLSSVLEKTIQPQFPKGDNKGL